MAQKTRNIIITVCGLLFFLAAISFAATEESDLKKFPPISGIIYGQAASGVKSISINGKKVKFDTALNYSATIKLKAGEKYLVLRINYEGVRIIKKYLIIRHEAIKTFKVFVPKEKIEKEIRASLPPKKTVIKEQKKNTHPRKKFKINKPPVIIQAAKNTANKPATLEYLYVWEFSEGKLLLVREIKGKYAADIYVPASKEWLELKGLSDQDLRDLIMTPTKEAKGKKK